MCRVLNVCFLSGGSLLRIIRRRALGFGLKESGGKSKNAVFREYLIRTSVKQEGDTVSPHLGAPAPGTEGNTRHPEALSSRGAGAAEEQGRFQRKQTHHSGLLLLN